MENHTSSHYKCNLSRNHFQLLEILRLLQRITVPRGIYSIIELQAAGFKYTNNGSTARCYDCGLEESNWTQDVKPFSLHSQKSPTCPFVRSMFGDNLLFAPIPRITTECSLMPNILTELESLKQVRKRSFSRWPHRSSPSSSQMIDAGFFNCNVGDRVICIYCNLICQQWTPNTDDPVEIHKTLSPKCPYVMSMAHSLPTTTTSNANSLQMLSNFKRTAIHKKYAESKKRHESFLSYPDDNILSVDQLVKAGFFYTGTKNIVTCFYCNGSLQNWSADDNPLIEHARWFPHCAYARQLCDAETYQRILDSRRHDETREKTTSSIHSFGVSVESASGVSLSSSSSDGDIGRLVVARLDLPVSQRLVNLNFHLSIIKRCWEDQLRLNKGANPTDADLFMACTILQKQIKHINGNRDNIIIPCLAMKKIRDQTGIDSSLEVFVAKSSEKNLCLLCAKEEKCMACIPCAHLVACIGCRHTLRTCPTCRREIEAFVRIYQ